MPIYEYWCFGCETTFERLELSIQEIPTSPCPVCGVMGEKLISRPSIIYEVFDETKPERLPDWNEKMVQARQRDAWTRRTLRPLPHDRGQGIRTYEMDFGHQERTALDRKARLGDISL